ncbi:MAG: 2OG-Fe(II) oxygenase [Alphaproteobacteria bacterium]|nr:2OG-Fe(II) oxygenase [Alphaproteobacteria bacterium]
MPHSPPPPLRRELLTTPDGAGGLHVYDPILERVHHLSAADLAGLGAPDDALSARLAAAILVEGPAADAVRAQVLAARLAAPPKPPAVADVPDVDWSRAEDLPDGLSPRWRDGETLRRLAEDRAAGARVLTLRGFLAPAFVDVVRREVEAMALERLDTAVVAGWRRRVTGLAALRELLTDPVSLELFGAVLGVSLPDELAVNAWKLDPGDHMRVHPDGPRYRATFALGLNAAWTAADGGAIAFGAPRGADFVVRERWLPHQGDLCLFVPDATSWHVVEPPRRTRWTVSGWWTA